MSSESGSSPAAANPAPTALGGSLDNLDSPEALTAIALLAALALAGALFVRRQIALGRA